MYINVLTFLLLTLPLLWYAKLNITNDKQTFKLGHMLNKMDILFCSYSHIGYKADLIDDLWITLKNNVSNHWSYYHSSWGLHTYVKTIVQSQGITRVIRGAVFIKQTAVLLILLMYSLREFSGAISNTIKNKTLWQPGNLCIKYSVVGK